MIELLEIYHRNFPNNIRDEEIINNPNTADNIYVSVIMLMLSTSLLSCEVICLSKVIPRKNK